MVKEVYMKNKYIEICYFYAGATNFYKIKMTNCDLSISHINNNVFPIFI
jgi:hypothetical protein